MAYCFHKRLNGQTNPWKWYCDYDNCDITEEKCTHCKYDREHTAYILYPKQEEEPLTEASMEKPKKFLSKKLVSKIAICVFTIAVCGYIVFRTYTAIIGM